MLVHIYNLRTWETEAGRIKCSVLSLDILGYTRSRLFLLLSLQKQHGLKKKGESNKVKLALENPLLWYKNLSLSVLVTRTKRERISFAGYLLEKKNEVSQKQLHPPSHTEQK